MNDLKKTNWVIRNFSFQDDYLDCYGDPAVTGKVGTDIQEGKCSWLIIQVLQRTTKEQRKELKLEVGWKNVSEIFLLWLFLYPGSIQESAPGTVHMQGCTTAEAYL